MNGAVSASSSSRVIVELDDAARRRRRPGRERRSARARARDSSIFACSHAARSRASARRPRGARAIAQQVALRPAGPAPRPPTRRARRRCPCRRGSCRPRDRRTRSRPSAVSSSETSSVPPPRSNTSQLPFVVGAPAGGDGAGDRLLDQHDLFEPRQAPGPRRGVVLRQLEQRGRRDHRRARREAGGVAHVGQQRRDTSADSSSGSSAAPAASNAQPLRRPHQPLPFAARVRRDRRLSARLRAPADRPPAAGVDADDRRRQRLAGGVGDDRDRVAIKQRRSPNCWCRGRCRRGCQIPCVTSGGMDEMPPVTVDNCGAEVPARNFVNRFRGPRGNIMGHEATRSKSCDGRCRGGRWSASAAGVAFAIPLSGCMCRRVGLSTPTGAAGTGAPVPATASGWRGAGRDRRHLPCHRRARQHHPPARASAARSRRGAAAAPPARRVALLRRDRRHQQ